jgi:uncharacterized protein (TIGR01777 family)
VRIAVTGASGLIGSALVPSLRAAGHDVVRLVRREPATDDEARWDPAAGSIDAAALQGVDAIVHLAGENIGQRWSERARREIRESRVHGTTLIAETAAGLEPRPRVLVCASGIDYYGDRGDEELTEESGAGGGFAAEVVVAWEQAAAPAREAGIRVAHLRQAMVLSRRGGALRRLLTPSRLGVGGRVGNGRQWWPWISLPDVVRAYEHVLAGDLEGPVNAAAPGAVTNEELAKALGRALRRPAVLPLPALAIRLAFGQMGEEMLLGSKRAVPARLAASGFAFEAPGLDAGLAAALER